MKLEDVISKLAGTKPNYLNQFILMQFYFYFLLGCLKKQNNL